MLMTTCKIKNAHERPKLALTYLFFDSTRNAYITSMENRVNFKMRLFSIMVLLAAKTTQATQVTPPEPALAEDATLLLPMTKALGMQDGATFINNTFRRKQHLELSSLKVDEIFNAEQVLDSVSNAVSNPKLLTNTNFGIELKKDSKNVPPEDFPKNAVEMRELMNPNNENKVTMILQGVDAHPDYKQIRKLKENIQADLKTKISMNLYVSPLGSRALPAHTDPYDVFIIQLAGEKTWTLCEPKARANMTAADIMLAMEVERKMPNGCSNPENPENNTELKCSTFVIKPGEIMYLPQGLVHKATATTTAASYHLTIGIIQQNSKFESLIKNSLDEETTEIFKKYINQPYSGVEMKRPIPLYMNTTKIYPHFNKICNKFKSYVLSQTPTDNWNVINSLKTICSEKHMDLVIEELINQPQEDEMVKVYDEVHENDVRTLFRRSERPRRAHQCCLGTPSAYYQCPNGEVMHKITSGVIRQSCDCDGYLGLGGCDCDFTNCRTTCYIPNNGAECSFACGEYQVLEGCGNDTVIDGSVCGRCVDRIAGSACSSTSNPARLCKSGACLGRCCAANVHTNGCIACGNDGKCVEWKIGYTGQHADECAEGYHKSNGVCAPNRAGGKKCTDNDQCVTGVCKGGHCCSETSKHCQSCGAVGECVGCQFGRNPADNCNTCLPTHYPVSSSGDVECHLLLHPGQKCSSKENLFVAYRNDACLTKNCKGICCSEEVSEYCTECESGSGYCSRCIEPYSLYNHKCYKKCWDNGKSVNHNDKQKRIRYEHLSPVKDGQTCSDLVEEQTRTCNNGIWGNWTGPHLYTNKYCNERCFTPKDDTNLYICPDTKDVDSLEMCVEGNTRYYVSHEEVAVVVRYQTDKVAHGEKCIKGLIIEECNDGKLTRTRDTEFEHPTCDQEITATAKGATTRDADSYSGKSRTDPDSDNNDNKTKKTISIVIPIVVVLILGVVFAVMLYLYKQRRSGKSNFEIGKSGSYLNPTYGRSKTAGIL
eukprot:m.66783 g.66783  ORF g.66783 m.66783 type:complete len:996 (-) comp11837_c0_seq2:96-3083(-)